MSIRRQILLVTLAAVLGAAAAMALTSRLILARGFAKLEQAKVRNAVGRARAALDYELDGLSATTGDWAYWDDTYQFVQDGNSRYIQSNLTDTAIANLKLDLVLFVSRSGHVVYVKTAGRGHSADGKPVTEGEALRFDSVLARCLASKTARGLIAGERGVMLVAAMPVLTSANTGPPQGMLVMGRRLSAEDIEGMSRRTATEVTIHPLHGRATPADFRALAASLLSTSERVLVKEDTDRAISGYALLNDIYGRPAVIVRADVERDVHLQGGKIMRYLSLALLGAMALFGVVVNRLLQRVVTSRLSSLTAAIQGIAARGDVSARVAIQGRDELASLAATLNMMLVALEQSQQALKENESRLRTVLDSVQTGIIIVDARTHEIVEVNSAALEMSGATRAELVGAVCHKLVCPAENGKCPITDLRQPVDNAERVLLTRDGGEVPVLKRAIRVSLDGRECILESFLDITDRKKAEEAVRYQAYHDDLTGLPNRLKFQQELTRALAQAEQTGTSVAVLLLDLDRFKTINDTLGHPTGDKLLQAVAGRLVTCLRTRDAVARLGGDEFALLVPDLKDLENTAHVARRALEAIRPPINVDGFNLHTTASMGISVFPKDGVTVEQLLQSADIALYHAKDQGRNTFRHYASWINATAKARLALENDLRRALANDEFVLHYQPQVHVLSRQIVGMEALLRWQHPELGLLLPGEFISLAEESGLMEPIGEWVLGEACRQGLAWQQAGLGPIKVAVNLSPSQFRQQRIARRVGAMLKETGLAPSCLELEITESAVMMNLDLAMQFMTRLKEVGVRLCMDDFGVGHTSLIHLKQFPIDTLKIDGSFLRAIETSPTDAAIVSAIIAISDSLGLLVIGEAVETPSQMRFLQDRGCETMQGFLFSRPVTADEATELVLRNRSARQEAHLV